VDNVLESDLGELDTLKSANLFKEKPRISIPTENRGGGKREKRTLPTVTSAAPLFSLR
jgi:hypothetical protein